MTARVRFLRRIVPRFGLAWTFAAMLLFVSAAGWFEFHYDLHVEEERTIAELAEAGCTANFRRYGDRERRSDRDDHPWVAIPYLDRIREMTVTYDWPEDRALVDRAATLPYLMSFEATPTIRNPLVLPFETKRHLEATTVVMPSPRDVPAPGFDEPLSDGEALSEEEAASVLANWKAAWSQPEPTSKTGIVRVWCEDELGTYQWDTVEALGPSGRLTAISNRLILLDSTASLLLGRDGEGLFVLERVLDPRELEHRLNGTGEFVTRSTGRNQLEYALDFVHAQRRMSEIAATLDHESFESLRRIDDGLVRADLAPFTLSYPAERIEDEIAVRLLLRPDREFAVESFDLGFTRTDAQASDQPPTRMDFTFRGVASDHDGLYCLDAFAHDMPNYAANWDPVAAPRIVRSRYRVAMAYDFAQEPPPEVFEAATYGAIEFPPRRELPTWRWYRATFALGCALSAYLAAKSVLSRGRRRPSASDAVTAEIEPEKAAP